MDRKRLYVEHAKGVRDRMAEVVSRITCLCRNKGKMDKGKVTAIMERVAEPCMDVRFGAKGRIIAE